MALNKSHKYLEAFHSCSLFAGLTRDEIVELLDELVAQEVTYRKHEFVLHLADCPRYVGVLIEGKADITQEDFWGNRNLIAQLHPGQIFAESFAFTNSETTVAVQAQQDSTVVWLDPRRIFQSDSSTDTYRIKIAENLIGLFARKNRYLNQKLRHISQRTTKEKLLSYLSSVARANSSDTFTIPFDRQQLADYLSVERSAMCSELSKLQKQGYLTYHRSTFTLHRDVNI